MNTDHTHCPDCGQPYRPYQVVFAEKVTPVTEVEEATEAELTVSYHESLECPVAEERDLISGLRQAVYHFGPAGTVARLADVIEEFEREGRQDENGRPRDLVRPLREYHRGGRGESRSADQETWQEVIGGSE